MSGDLLLGIDIGTYESKGAIVDRSGAVVAQAAVPHGLSMPRPGWAEHDAEQIWWRDFCHLCHNLFEASGLRGADIDAVGCSTIAPCMLPVDERGRPLRPAILYGVDTRSAPQIAALEQELGVERILHNGGCALSTQSVGPKIRWLREEEPEIFRQAYMFHTGASYLLFKLTGEAVVDHYTGLAYGPLFNVRELRWDPELCPAVVEPERLPRLGWTTEIAGQVSALVEQETGLAAGTPVIVGTADAAAEAVSAGVVAPGQMMIMYGSTMFFLQVRAGLAIDRRLWAGVYLFPGTYAVAAGMATSGSITRWFRDNFAQAELERQEAGGPNAYAELAAEIAAVPAGSGGLLALPYFSGERTPLDDPLARGVIAGLTLSHTRAHVYRALLEGIAYAVRHNLETMAELGQAPDEMIAVGGGTRNRTWMQIVSDVCGLAQSVPAHTFGAAYGDAFLAGHGIGAFNSYRDVAAWVTMVDRVVPDASVRTTYDAYFALYRALYEDSKHHVHLLAQMGSQ